MAVTQFGASAVLTASGIEDRMVYGCESPCRADSTHTKLAPRAPPARVEAVRISPTRTEQRRPGIQTPDLMPGAKSDRHSVYWAIRLFCAACTRLSVQNVQFEP